MSIPSYITKDSKILTGNILSVGYYWNQDTVYTTSMEPILENENLFINFSKIWMDYSIRAALIGTGTLTLNFNINTGINLDTKILNIYNTLLNFSQTYFTTLIWFKSFDIAHGMIVPLLSKNHGNRGIVLSGSYIHFAIQL